MKNPNINTFRNAVIAGIVGITFSLGLGISGMTQPSKVIGFLNVTGPWDPSLLFVLLGSVIFHFITYRLIRRRQSPLFSAHWHVPTKRDLTPSLIVGSILFGIGWGLAGYCPGPAIASLASLDRRPIIFVVAMILGMLLFKWVDRKIQFKR